MSEHTPRFFPTPADFRAWLEENHATTDHLWVGYYDSWNRRRIKQLRKG